jgi:hypothetical protein
MIHHSTLKSRICRSCSAVVIPVVVLGGLAWAATGGAAVSANYLQAGGASLVVQVSIDAPPPRSLILVQRLPPGTRILEAQPPASQVSPGQGEAKWLLRNPVPGHHTIRMTLEPPVDAGALSGQILYLPAQGGDMQSRPIAGP